MTQSTQVATTRVIVVGEDEVYSTLTASGVSWDLQHQVKTLAQMRDDLGAGRLNAQSSILVISDLVPAQPGELEALVAWAAPYLHVFVVAWDPDGADALYGRIMALLPDGPDGAEPKVQGIYFIPADTGAAMLEGMKAVLETYLPWPASYTPDLYQPLTRSTVKVAVFNPGVLTPAQPPAAQPVVAALPVASALPAASAQPVYTQPVTSQPAYSRPATGPVIGQAVTGTPIPGQVTLAVTSSKGGSGKCLPGETMLVDPVTGVPTRLDTVVGGAEHRSVLTFDQRFIREAMVTDKINSGVKDTFTITLRSGREIRATANHPFLTTDGWTPLQDLQVGTTVATPARIPFPLTPTPMDNAELDLLAVLLAEGGTSTRDTRVTNFDQDIIELTRTAANNLGMRMTEIIPGQVGQYRLGGGTVLEKAPVGFCECGCGQETLGAAQSSTARGLRAGDPQRFLIGHGSPETTLRRLRRTHGLDGVLAKNKTMPEAVYRLPEGQLARLVALFWMCDGYAVPSGGGDVGLTLASRDLVYGFQHLLLRFGIQSKVAPKTATFNGKTFPAWRLSVIAGSLQVFAAKIPLWGAKATAVNVLAERATTAGPAGNPNVGMPSYGEGLRTELVGLNGSGASKKAAKALGWNLTAASPSMVLFHKATKNGVRHLSLRGLAAYAEASNTQDTYGWIYDSEVFWDDIVSVQPHGPEQVWDLTVDQTHNFVANDVIVHNSTTAMLVAATIAHGSRKSFEAGLAPRPLKVVLVDMDTRDGQVASMIGQYMPTAINIRVEPRWDEATILRNLVHSDRLEIDCLLAPVRPRSADDVGPEFYRHVLRTLQCTHDVVVMDTSVNYLDPLISTVCLPESTAIMFVTTLVSTAVQGMARALNEITGDVESDGMGIPAEKIGVVVNQAMRNVGMDKGQVLEAALGVPIIGQVPMASQDVQLATNHNRMHMLMEHQELGPAYFALAQACMPNTQLLPPAVWASTGGSRTPTAPAAATQPAQAPVRAKRGGLFHRG